MSLLRKTQLLSKAALFGGVFGLMIAGCGDSATEFQKDDVSLNDEKGKSSSSSNKDLDDEQEDEQEDDEKSSSSKKESSSSSFLYEENNPNVTYGKLKDTRDKQVYLTVDIGN